MKQRTILAFALILSLLSTMFGHTPWQPLRAALQQGDDDVVRITTNLVQVDAVVTDKSGKQVTDLKAEDFEILEDGRPQKITNFSYFSNDAASPAQSVAGGPAKRDATPAPPSRVTAANVRRTIVLVIDDLAMSFETISRTRTALKKFVDEQIQPGDIATIVRTSGGTGALQQLTSDKARLRAAIERVRWQPTGRTGVDTFSTGAGSNSDMTRSEREGATPPALVINDVPTPSSAGGVGPGSSVASSLKALNFIVSGLKELPGRKSILLFSDNFSIFPSLKGNEMAEYERMTEGLGGGGADKSSADRAAAANAAEKQLEDIERRMIDLSSARQESGSTNALVSQLLDLANQASVVIYTVDPRGQTTYNLGADTTGRQAIPTTSAPASVATLTNMRSLKFQQTQVGLSYVAQQTGGFLISNNNDLSGSIQRVLDDLKGYYLIGYRPSEGTFAKDGSRSRFHKLRVVVKRPGLTVRSRKGFFGVTEEQRRTAPASREEQLLAALNSPFQTGDINLRLTSLFSNDLRAGSFMRSLLHVDVKALSFKPDAEGWQTASMEVMAVTYSDSGEVLEQIGRAETIQARGATFQRLLSNGLVYAFDVPVKKAGSYQLRVAVRDAGTGRTGSANQLIEVPDLKQGRLALSGIYARGIDPATVSTAKPSADSEAAVGLLSAPPKIGDSEGAADGTGAQPGPAARRLRQGMLLDYSYVIFNAKREDGTGRRQVQTQARLFRDGQQVWAGEIVSLDTSNQTDPTRLVMSGRVPITADMTPGEYVLQIVVTDALSKAANRTASQWIDFMIVK